MQQMLQQRANAHTQSALATYRNEQYLNLTPVQVIHKLMETGVIAMKKGDTRLALRVLTELILALNFEHKEVSLGFFRLYDYCKHCIHNDRTDEAIQVLDELRATWAQAFHLKEAA